MILNEEKQENIITSGGFKETEFKIKNKEFIFEVLSDKIYNNKIGAIIREIISNAVDANIESKSKKKLILHLPTNKEKYFSIRDFGPGINSERIKVFVSFGDSTKRDSADQIGYYGMGSKSPFSYTDSFYITTWVGGHKNEYMAYIGDDKKRALTLLNRTKSDEPNGTEIKINLKSEYDCSKFRDEFNNIWGYSKRLFDISGDTSFNSFIHSKLQELHNRNDLFFGRYEYSSCCLTVMNGHIAYNLDMQTIHSLDSYFKMRETSKNFTFFNQNNLVLKFKVGELRLSVSRESLEICEQNAKAIENKVRNLMQEIKTNIHIRWESNNNNCIKIKNFIKTYKQYGIINFPNYFRNDILVRFEKIYTGKGELFIGKCGDSSTFSAINESFYFYYIVGKTDKIEGRVRRFFEVNSDKELNMIKFSSKEAYEDFKKNLPFIPLIPIHAFVHIPKKRAEKKAKDVKIVEAIKENKIKLFKGYMSMESIHSKHFFNELENMNTTKYYLTTSFNKLILDDEMFSGMKAYHGKRILGETWFMDAFKKVFEVKPKVFVFSGSLKTSIPKHWIPFEKKFSDVIVNGKVSDSEYIGILFWYYNTMRTSFKLPSSISKKLFDKIFNKGRKIVKNSFCNDNNKFINLVVEYNKELRNRIAKDIRKLLKESKVIAKKFPALFINEYETNRFISKLRVESVDAAKKYIKENVK